MYCNVFDFTEAVVCQIHKKEYRAKCNMFTVFNIMLLKTLFNLVFSTFKNLKIFVRVRPTWNNDLVITVTPRGRTVKINKKK